MVVLDLNLVKNQGLSSRQSSFLGAGDSWASGSQADEADEAERKMSIVLKKASHLYLQSKNITKISPQVNKLRGLKVIYLYDNKITNVAPLAHATNLTHVYLQGNDLESTRGISKMRKLEKIYLSNNRIEVVEDICDPEGDGNLQELYLENQRLPQGHPLVFEPNSLDAMKYSLKVLNISGNNIQTIDNVLQTMYMSLEKLDASNNQIKALDVTDRKRNGQDVLRFPYLVDLSLKGNPFQKRGGTKKYRQELVVKFERVETLDGSEISSFERKWHQAFSEKKRLDEQRAAAIASQQSLPREISNASLDPRLNDMTSLSTADLVPPVPEHWRSRGLPGARHQFDQVLAKARSQASQRLTSEVAMGEMQRVRKERELATPAGMGGGETMAMTGESITKFEKSYSDLSGGETSANALKRQQRNIMKLSPMKLAPLDNDDPVNLY